MNGYYYLINTLKNYLKDGGFINTVTVGDISDVDLSKQTIFPLNHIMVNNGQPGDAIVTWNVSILFMDLVDESKSIITDIWEGNDNTQDILNTQSALATRLVTDLTRGDLFDDLVQLVNTPTMEPFTDRFENKLAGWTLTFDVAIPNDMTAC